MTQKKKTHKEIKNPRITSRYLADYMAASEQRRRTIIRDCKYPPIARLLHHNEAKQSISKFMTAGNPDILSLQQKSQQLRGRLADSDYDRILYDINADVIDRFVENHANINMPNAENIPLGKWEAIRIGGIKVSADARFRLQRVTKTNKVKAGLGTFRYAKDKALSEEIANWQSAFLFGYLNLQNLDGEEPEKDLCITLDVYGGKAHSAPSDSVSRFNNMEAACYTVAERWVNVEPPAGAIL